MNIDDLKRKLIAAARRHPPAEHVPLAFEKRITALLQQQKAPDHLAFWARGLWRSAAACLAACLSVMLLMGAISFFTPAPAESVGEMSDEFENTLLAVMEQDSEFLQ